MKNQAIRPGSYVALYVEDFGAEPDTLSTLDAGPLNACVLERTHNEAILSAMSALPENSDARHVVLCHIEKVMGSGEYASEGVTFGDLLETLAAIHRDCDALNAEEIRELIAPQVIKLMEGR